MSVTSVKMPKPVFDALQQASEKTGVDFDYLLRTAQRESGLNPQAKAPTSSATGLYQFIESTWLAMVHQHGEKFGLKDVAAQILRTSNGRYEVVNPAQREAILALREDAGLSALMAAQFTKDNGASLARDLGRLPTQAELYMAHFLGAHGAARLVEAVKHSNHVAAADIFPQAARANPTLFYHKGKPVSVARLYDQLGATFSQQFLRSDLAFQVHQLVDQSDTTTLLPSQLLPAPRLLDFDFDGLYTLNGSRVAPSNQSAHHLAFFHHFSSQETAQDTPTSSDKKDVQQTSGLWDLYRMSDKIYGE